MVETRPGRRFRRCRALRRSGPSIPSSSTFERGIGNAVPLARSGYTYPVYLERGAWQCAARNRMVVSTLKLRLLRRALITAASSSALWCTAAAAGESGRVERSPPARCAGRPPSPGATAAHSWRAKAASWFASSAEQRQVPVWTSKRLARIPTLRATSGSGWRGGWVGGEGRRDLLGGAGKYAGVSGACTYSTRHPAENRIFSVTGCEERRP